MLNFAGPVFTDEMANAIFIGLIFIAVVYVLGLFVISLIYTKLTLKFIKSRYPKSNIAKKTSVRKFKTQLFLYIYLNSLWLTAGIYIKFYDSFDKLSSGYIEALVLFLVASLSILGLTVFYLKLRNRK